MGTPRICSRCMVRLVTNVAHSRIWCPVCKRQLRLANHGEAAMCCAPPQPGAAHRPPPPPPPPLPRPCPRCEDAPAPIIAPPRHTPGDRTFVLAGLFLIAVALVVGGLAFALAVPREGDTLAGADPPPPKKPAPVAARKKATPPKPEPAPPTPGRLLAEYEARQEKTSRSVFQQDDGARLPAAEGGAAAARRIDELVLAGLKAKAISPAPLCSDGVFVRRVYLDVIGRIPTAEEAKQFLDDRDPGRRPKLIDRLLAHRDFADYWTMKWCDLLRVKSEFPINLWPNAVQAYHRWIRASVRDNVPFDRFARELLTSSGSNFRDPPANFYRAVQKKDPANLARAVALTFMGVRSEGWPRERWAGVEVFFSQVGYKRTGEWKEEVVFHDLTKPLDAQYAVFPDGTRPVIEPGQDPREAFADWLITPANPWFTRNIANRAWSWLVGRGIIHEADDVRPDNPPSNPELLAHLERELVAARYDVRALFRVILNSNTYQASSIPASDHPQAAALFAHYPVRRLEAEVLIDAICQVTGTAEKYSSPIPEPFTYIPESHRSVSLADASITSTFLEMFGRSPRDTGLESERNNNFTAPQRLHLLNSAHIMNKIESGPGLKQLIGAGGKPEQVAERLYLAILSRYPTPQEREVLAEYRSGGSGRRPGLDVAWALMNTAEFLCRH